MTRLLGANRCFPPAHYLKRIVRRVGCTLAPQINLARSEGGEALPGNRRNKSVETIRPCDVASPEAFNQSQSGLPFQSRSLPLCGSNLEYQK